MRIFLTALILATLATTSFAEKTYSINVRVTYYSAGSDSDCWSRKLQSSTGVKLQNMKSCAVDPNIIPYHSEIVLPKLNLKLKAVDTGSAVKSRKASKAYGRNDPVVDVFVECGESARNLARKNPMWTIAIVTEKKRNS